ncbi:hypothetical protein M8312_06865 [Sphingomonas sp. KRR8]|uniref:hypothetical protein n=1 Tax=Sphingomonas sp. KRR8 TaxID=2942996 RepID=UPI0020229892|nr:hypothetical protein [Sphingomonas sp. KRR8]URD62218.1 hypothetical protein M8312_06865 [Sphingomonas sp. KRR8]
MTAAEWFAQQQATASGAMVSVITRSALAAVSGGTPNHGDLVYLRESGREGHFIFDGSDLRALVTSDPRQGFSVAPSANTTGSAGAWVRKVEASVNVRWFGAAADFVTDDLGAFTACRDAILARKQGPFAGNRTMLIPAGRYYLSDRFDTKGLRVVGEHSGQPSGISSLLRFGKNKSGVRLTSGADNSASSLEGLQIWGGGVNVDATGTVTSYAAGDSITGNGVEVACDWGSCTDVSVAFFGGDGFSANSAVGNCNSFFLERCQSQYQRGCGYLIGGTDANAGTTISCSAISCGGSGIKDYSFLGNTHIQAHVRDCGYLDPTGSNGPVGACQYGSNPTRYYYVVAGREAQASTEQPGSISNGTEAWREYRGPAPKRWSAGLTWSSASPYQTNPSNLNARNVFVGCYAEGSQAPCQATAPSVFLGGLLDEVGFDGSSSGLWLRNESRGGLVVPGLSTWRPGTATNLVGGDPLQISAVNRKWDPAALGSKQGSVHLSHSVADGQGPAITFGTAQGDGAEAGAGIYVLSSAGYGTRMYLATTDTFGAVKNAVSIGEGGNVVIERGALQGHAPLNVRTVTAYTAAMQDRDSYLRFLTSSAATLTIPSSQDVNFPIGTTLTIEQGGVGDVIPTPGNGVTINCRGNVTKTAGQFAVALLTKVDGDVWTLTGDLA